MRTAQLLIPVATHYAVSDLEPRLGHFTVISAQQPSGFLGDKPDLISRYSFATILILCIITLIFAIKRFNTSFISKECLMHKASLLIYVHVQRYF